MIAGVIVRELEDLVNEQGMIQYMLRADDAEFFSGFGEIYFSSINPGVTKGWHRHEMQTSVLSCILGIVRLVVTDGAAIEAVDLGDGQRKLVRIPPQVAYAWTNLGDSVAMLANCASHVHDPSRSEKLPLQTFRYDWSGSSDATVE